ncbi:MAG: threonine--tRNA ligase [Candidatus Aenigmatarchaeota archaeon]|nr:threonine--tRNA ligase [Candidatus Aenigmarchaeota archaeon]
MYEDLIKAVNNFLEANVVEKGKKEDKYFVDFDCRVLYKDDIEKIQKYLDENSKFHYVILSFSSSFSKSLNKATQRIYFKVFETKEEKEKFLKELEEAKKRDHRYLGEKLDIFHIEEEIIGSGLPLFHFNGAIIIDELKKLIKEVNNRLGYREVITPHISKTFLWKLSGHYEKYKDRIFLIQEDDEEFGLKPMNCPMHLMIFKSRVRSYRDLPFRIAEFATVYRREQSGELHGLTRVWSITQDDHHCVLSMEHLKDEIKRIINEIINVYKIFGLDVKFNLSTRPENFIGNLEDWEFAEKTLREILEELNVKYEIKEKEGAFYGPKIDIDVKDAFNRYWQLATIQLDFNMPRRLDITYVDKDNKEKYPIMIHFAILGSFERFVGIILEHFAGKLPLWLAPIQVSILPLSEKYEEEAKKLFEELTKENIRAEILSEGTIEYRVRDAETRYIPYIIVIGKKEIESGNLTIRYRGTLFSMNKEEFKSKIIEKIRNRERD